MSFEWEEEEVEECERYFLERKRNGEYELYERDGTFYNHGWQDLLIATLYEEEQAEKVLNALLQQTTSK